MKKLFFLLLFIPIIGYSQEKMLITFGMSDKQIVIVSAGSVFSKNQYCGIEIAPPLFGINGHSNLQYGRIFKNDILLISNLGVFYKDKTEDVKFNAGLELGKMINRYYVALFVTNNYFGMKVGIKL